MQCVQRCKSRRRKESSLSFLVPASQASVESRAEREGAYDDRTGKGRPAVRAWSGQQQPLLEFGRRLLSRLHETLEASFNSTTHHPPSRRHTAISALHTFYDHSSAFSIDRSRFTTAKTYAHPLICTGTPSLPALPITLQNMAPASFAAAAQNAGATPTRDEWYVWSVGGGAQNFGGPRCATRSMARTSWHIRLTPRLTGLEDRTAPRKLSVDHPRPPPCRA